MRNLGPLNMSWYQPRPTFSAARRDMTAMGGFDQALHQAESRWCCGDLAGALEHYDSALQIANQAGDRGKIGMVMAGKGCALASTGDIEKVEIGLGCYHVAHSVAEKQGLNSQATFVQQLIKSTTNTLWQMKKEKGDAETQKGGYASAEPKTRRAEVNPLLVMLASCRCNDVKIHPVVTWQIPACVALEMVGRAPWSTKTINHAENCRPEPLSAQDGLDLTTQVGKLLQLPVHEVRTQLCKSAAWPGEIVANVYVHTSSFIERIHRAFDAKESGSLRLAQCREFLHTVRALEDVEFTSREKMDLEYFSRGVCARDAACGARLTCTARLTVE